MDAETTRYIQEAIGAFPEIQLAYAVIASGQLLHQRDVATRVEYEADVLSRYGDYLPPR